MDPEKIKLKNEKKKWINNKTVPDVFMFVSRWHVQECDAQP